MLDELERFPWVMGVSAHPTDLSALQNNEMARWLDLGPDTWLHQGELHSMLAGPTDTIVRLS